MTPFTDLRTLLPASSPQHPLCFNPRRSPGRNSQVFSTKRAAAPGGNCPIVLMGRTLQSPCRSASSQHRHRARSRLEPRVSSAHTVSRLPSSTRVLSTSRGDRRLQEPLRALSKGPGAGSWLGCPRTVCPSACPQEDVYGAPTQRIAEGPFLATTPGCLPTAPGVPPGRGVGGSGPF